MKLAHRISSVMLLLILAGCANTLHTLPADYALNTQEQSVVIGRVVIDMGTLMGMKPIGFFDRMSGSQLTVVNVATGKEFIIVCEKNGSDAYFYVELPPGLYKLSKWDRGNLTASPTGHFSTGPGRVTYLGTLKFTRKQGVGSFLAGAALHGFIGGWSVVDEPEEAVKAFHEHYPQLNQEIVTSLMALD
jgi:hypothetical protein